MLKLSLFEDEQKQTVFVCVPLNANELLLPAQGAELQELVSFYPTQTCTENSTTFSLLCSNCQSDNDGETQK